MTIDEIDALNKIEKKIKDILFNHRTDFSVNPFYTEFGIREENFDIVVKEILLVLDKTNETI